MKRVFKRRRKLNRSGQSVMKLLKEYCVFTRGRYIFGSYRFNNFPEVLKIIDNFFYQAAENENLYGGSKTEMCSREFKTISRFNYDNGLNLFDILE